MDMAQLLPLLLLLLMSCVSLRGCEVVEPPSNWTDLLGACPFSYCALEEGDNYTLLLDGTVVAVDTLHYNVSYYDNLSRPVICRETGDQTSESFSIALAVVFFIVLLLSVIGNVSLLVTYSLFKELRTLPGQVIMNLVAASLAENIVLIIGAFLLLLDSSSWYVYIHMYLVQARHIWMGLIGFEMSRTIYYGMKLYPDWSDKRKRFQLLIYLLIGWGNPVVLIAVPASVYSGDIETGVSIVYNVAFNLICIVFLFNGCTLIFLSVVLMTASAQQKKLKGQKINFFRVFISLLMLLGVTRFISIVIYVTESSSTMLLVVGAALEFPQSLVICIVLICNRKVIHMYLSLCCRKGM